MSSPFAQRSDFAADAQVALTSQFQRAIMQKIAEIYAAQIQDLETVCFQILNGRGVDTAIGVQLDGLGGNVGESRNGASDNAYRIRIKARLLINRSSGSPDQLLAIASLLIGQSASLVEYYPASIVIDATGPVLTIDQASALVTAIDAATAAGVKSQSIYGLSVKTSLFRFSASSVTEIDASKGFSDLSQVTGGKLSGVYANG